MTANWTPPPTKLFDGLRHRGGEQAGEVEPNQTALERAPIYIPFIDGRHGDAEFPGERRGACVGAVWMYRRVAGVVRANLCNLMSMVPPLLDIQKVAFAMLASALWLLPAAQVASAQVVPDPPQNLTAANHPSTTFVKVTLTWDTPDNTGDSPITQVCYRYQQQNINPTRWEGYQATPFCMPVPDMNKIVTGNLQAGLRHRFAVELRNSAGWSTWATVSFTPGFSPTLAVQPTSVAEDAAAKTVTVTATLGNRVTLQRDVPVTVSVGGGTATAGTDYTGVDDFTVTVKAGTLSAMGTFTLTPIDDDVDEGNETVEISGTETSFDIAKAKLTITDDDTAPSGAITLSLNPTSAGEAASATSVTVTATLPGSTTRSADTAITVAVGASADTATEGTDYATVDDFTLTIAAGARTGTKAFSIDPTQDALDEGTGESVSVSGTTTVSGFSVTGATFTITDDDTAPSGAITLSLNPTSAGEAASATSVTVTATLPGSTTRSADTAITVAVGASADTATEGTDYATVDDFTLTIAAGARTGTKAFSIDPTQDALDEGTGESVSVSGTTTVSGFSVTGATFTITDDDTAPSGAITLSLNPTSAGEAASATSVTVTATLPGSTTRSADTAITVAVGASADTATEGTDYATVDDFTLTIAAGARTGTKAFSIDPTQDALDEGTGESVSVSGTTTVSGFSVTGATFTITDDDTAPSGAITLSLNPTSAGEAASATSVTVTATLPGSTTRSADTAITVAVGASADTATEGTDYATVDDFTLTIAAGARTGTKAFSIDPTQDALDEGTGESVSVSGTTTVSGFSVTGATFTITDDDTAPSGAITLSLNPTSAGEAASATSVTVTATLPGSTTRSADTAITVAVGASADTATEGTDYATVDDFTLTIAAGARTGTKAFSIDPTQDALDEGTGESVSVSGTTTVSGFSVTGATFTITDDDTAPSMSLVLTPASISENGGVSTVTATLSSTSSEAMTMTVSVTAVSPATASDYTLSANRTLTIAAGATTSTGTVTITGVDNDMDAPNKEFTVLAATAAGHGVANSASEILTIEDDDDAPSVSIADTTVDEGGMATFVVTRAGATGNVVSVRAATAGHVGGEHPASTSDYVPVTVAHTLSFGAGETRKIFSVQTMEDTLNEPNETFMARLSGTTSNAVIAADGTQATGTIMDDDRIPAISIADAVPVVEGATASFPVRLSAVSGMTVTVEWVTSPGTATEDADYGGDKGTIAIAAGSTDATIEVGTIDDTEIEGKEPETFTVTLLNPVNGTIDEPVATGTIEDDDYLAAVARIKRVNTAMLPRVGSALMRSRIDQLADCIDHAATGNGIVGLSALGESLSSNAEALNRGELSLQEALAGTRLAAKVPVNRDRPGSGDMTFCAGGDWRRLSSIDDSPVTWEGNLFGAHVGGNMRLGESVLLGLDVSHHTSSLDWSDEAGAGVFAGDWRMRLNAVHPYVTWFTSQGLRLSAMAGYGSGNIRIVEKTGLDQPADLTLKSVALGGVLPLETGRGGTSLRFRGDAWLGELKVEDNGSLVEGLSVATQGVRVLAEGKWRVALGDDASLAPSTRIGLQYDDGAGGMGLEVGSGLRWDSPTHGLSAALSGRFLLVRDGIREWGMSADARLAPTQGLGPSFTFSPSWGATADGTEALWEHGLEAASYTGNELAAPSLKMESGWGLRLSDGRGVLTPFVGLSLSGEDARRMRLGGRLEVNRFSLEVAGMRRESGSTAPDHGLYLKVVASW